MPKGYHGRILRVNLSQRRTSVEEPDETFYRRYYGGRGLISYYLLKELKPGTDPLGPQNKLIFAAGPVTGAPTGGSGRNSVGGKSPLTGAYGDGEVGGYFGAELKRAGYDAIIVEGRAEKPVYLWINDGKAEIRDATHIWGKPTLEAQRIIQEELGGDTLIRTAMIGPAGENRVLASCVLNDINRAAGRTGMGAVMGSKNLKAVAVRGRKPVEVADPQGVARMARWLRDNVKTLVWGLHDLGTDGGLPTLNRDGGLPTRNFQLGDFEHADAISGLTMKNTILVDRASCFGCPVRCKRVVEVKEPYKVDPLYGGPEYETVAAIGSNCGVGDLKAIAKGNELCSAWGLDTIEVGTIIGFAMECFERGLLTTRETDGLELRFGNAEAMLQMIEKITYRRGIGNLLADGVARAAKSIGRGAEEYAMEVKGQEFPMHEPRYKMGMGIGYAMSPTGADHCHDIHDSAFTGQSPQLEHLKALGVVEPLPLNDLSGAKVRMYSYVTMWRYALNCLVTCLFMPWNYNQTAEVVQLVTGWNTSVFELMKLGERALHLTRAFNVREGFTKAHDTLPNRMFTPFPSGPLKGVAIDQQQFETAKNMYYEMMGWQGPAGVPSEAKLHELNIGWVADELKALRPVPQV